MRDALARELWGRKGVKGKLLWVVLLPLSFLYRACVQTRNAFFQLGWLKSVPLPRPVISIGNLTVGGTGKTPTCLWLAGELRRRGLKVGILSRGYRREQKTPLVLVPKTSGMADKTDDVLSSGDEPAMMARIYGEAVGVCRNRSEAAAELLRATDVDVFILDDGFQHRWVKRNIDVLLLGGETSGCLLPAGPFREPRKSLRRSDFLIATGAQDVWNHYVPESLRAVLYRGALRPVSLVGFAAQQLQEVPLSWLYRSKILAVAGVADPSGLYRFIHECDGEIVKTLEFPDHHRYTTADWQEIARMGRMVDLIITTEKDILKLRQFPFAKDKLLALRVAMTVDNGAALVEAIMQRLPLGGRN
jgi:tetraacyldisaccharide 4'-kinase